MPDLQQVKYAQKKSPLIWVEWNSDLGHGHWGQCQGDEEELHVSSRLTYDKMRKVWASDHNSYGYSRYLIMETASIKALHRPVPDLQQVKYGHKKSPLIWAEWMSDLGHGHWGQCQGDQEELHVSSRLTYDKMRKVWTSDHNSYGYSRYRIMETASVTGQITAHRR